MPLPLKDGFGTISIAPRRIRLQHRIIAEHAQEDEKDAQKLWCFDVCHHPKDNADENTWIPTYCFTTTEFLPQDYEMMSWFTSTSPRCFFIRSILCTKMIMDEETEEIVGDYSLFNDNVRKTVGGKREVVRELKTEQDRLDALEEIFGVRFTQEQKDGITPEMRLG